MTAASPIRVFHSDVGVAIAVSAPRAAPGDPVRICDMSIGFVLDELMPALWAAIEAHAVHRDLIADLAAASAPDWLDVPPHERVGPLPPRIKARVELLPLYCGRRTRRGTRCRIPVATPGGTCRWHRPPAATADGIHPCPKGKPA